MNLQDIFVKEISFDEYRATLNIKIPFLGDYLVQRSEMNQGALLTVFYGEIAIGIAVMEFKRKPLLSYIFVEEGFRRQGIGKKLVTAAVNLTKDKGLADIEAKVVLQNEYGDVVNQLLQKNGFEIYDTSTIIRYGNSEKCNYEWNDFKEKRGNKIIKFLQCSGYNTISFSAASLENITALRAEIGQSFPSNLDPFDYISNKVDRLVPKYSFITLKNNIPVAFAILTTADEKTLVFQQLSTAYKYQGKGIFILPFAAFMESFLHEEVFLKMSAQIMNRNNRMKKLIDGFMSKMAESIKTQNIYRIRAKQK